MGIELNEYNKQARGGTELLIEEFQSYVPRDLLDHFQIIPSRFRTLDESKIRILWVHDLPEDPEYNHLKGDGHKKFHLLVFVSNWQMQRFIERFQIPWEKCIVLQNAIRPFTPEEIEGKHDVKDGIIKLIYHTTPHRGLNILVPVFARLCEEFKNIHLDVYSSLLMYGPAWAERDKTYAPLYDQIKSMSQATYHGAVDQPTVRQAVAQAHIFAYPSTWQETSCRCLMEAMSAGCLSVHPNYAALFETSAGLTRQYQFSGNLEMHAHSFYQVLRETILNYKRPETAVVANVAKWYADSSYNWEQRGIHWAGVLKSLYDIYKDDTSVPGEQFVYKTTKDK